MRKTRPYWKIVRRDCKVDFIWFYINPSVIFCFKKMTAPFTREPVIQQIWKFYATVGANCVRPFLFAMNWRTTAIQPPLCKGRCRTNVRRRDCKVDFIWICKIPQSFFCSKNDSSLYKGTFDGQPQGSPLRVVGIFHSVRSTHFFSLFTIHFSLPDRAYVPFASQKMDYEFDSRLNQF